MNRREIAERVPLTWDPVQGGHLPRVHWHDKKTVDLGSDPDGSRFEKIADLMLSGDYYPREVIQFYGRFRDEKRDLKVGDRVLQRFVFMGIVLWSAVEIWLAEREAERCAIGYVTTSYHHGRGIWQAHLERVEGRLRLTVQSTSGPQSWLFWLALPIGRAQQLRAREEAIRRFLAL